ncbi:hypothetical protein N7478_009664 [Penicillium angulare]|uniref:uncharacterized protein n=1 Tax=Penicillium angulare TaxID=116970 RepID=UPI00253F90D4|nr:uncharacterized protein N7478_009664 [Penicillium angulare]KAJ5266856.1 hypothetical protein N7478_009664 [Penicillium angulare]
MSGLQVTVTLTPLGRHFPLQRNFTLSKSNRTIMIGRSSKRETKLRSPGPENGWYESRVMSRDHAELFIESGKQILKINDLDSTHGTWLNNTRLIHGEAADVNNGDILRFGVDVENGQESFPALIVRCMIDWSGEEYAASSAWFPWSDADYTLRNTSEIHIDHVNRLQPTTETKPLSGLRPVSSTNTFQVPESDSDVEEITKLDWPSQKPEASSHVDEATVSHFPTPISSDTQDIKATWLDYLGTSTDHADPIKVNANEKPINPASNIAYPGTIDLDPSMDVSEDGESDRKFSVSYDDYEDSIGYELEEEIDREIADALCDSELDENSSNAEYDSDDVSSVSDGSGSSDDESSSVDNGREQEYLNPIVLTPSKALPKCPDVPTTKKDFSTTVASFDNENTARMWPFLDSIPHTQTSYMDSAIPTPWKRPAPLSLNGGDFTRSRGPMDISSVLHDPALSSVSYHDGPFASIEFATKEIKNERSPPLPQLPVKRKASELESQAQPLTPKSAPSQVSNLSTAEQKEAATAISSALSEAEPPTKRTKSSHSSSSNVATYTATAVISALLGGLGTIALLAALPAEYFQ